MKSVKVFEKNCPVPVLTNLSSKGLAFLSQYVWLKFSPKENVDINSAFSNSKVIIKYKFPWSNDISVSDDDISGLWPPVL